MVNILFFVPERAQGIMYHICREIVNCIFRRNANLPERLVGSVGCLVFAVLDFGVFGEISERGLPSACRRLADGGIMFGEIATACLLKAGRRLCWWIMLVFCTYNFYIIIIQKI